MLKKDVCIIGAGPVGLFAAFELGLLKMRSHIVDSLPQVGGQLSEIYPKKPIYDIPGFVKINAEDLVDNLMQQIEPFKPTFTLGERVESLEKEGDHFVITTSKGTKIESKVIVIAGGLGCFEPRKPDIPNLLHYENKGVDYIIKNPDLYNEKYVTIAGGGDAALDWAIYLANNASNVTLVHRSGTFRGSPDSVHKIHLLARAGKINLFLNAQITQLFGTDKLEAIEITTESKNQKISTDYFIPLFGLSPRLGPLENWGLNIEKNSVQVNVVDYATNIPGVFAIGDINMYAGKLKLILCGFHEAAHAARAAYEIIYPGNKYSLKYTTINGINTF